MVLTLVNGRADNAARLSKINDDAGESCYRGPVSIQQ
jgi:hypothetical protein